MKNKCKQRTYLMNINSYPKTHGRTADVGNPEEKRRYPPYCCSFATFPASVPVFTPHWCRLGSSQSKKLLRVYLEISPVPEIIWVQIRTGLYSIYEIKKAGDKKLRIGVNLEWMNEWMNMIHSTKRNRSNMAHKKFPAGFWWEYKYCTEDKRVLHQQSWE